jgi:hypothetical protein
MFKHAIESFEHGLKHFLDSSERSRKFALLHIDQAVELLLKEKIVQLGKTIYKSDGKTLNFHEACKSLKDVEILQQPRLEELHDLRNSVQHKGLVPDSESTRFYVEIAYRFFKQFLSEHFETSIDKFITRQDRALIEELSLPSPVEKVIGGYTALNRIVNFFRDPDLGRMDFRSTLRGAAALRGVDPEELEQHLDTVLRLWDRIAYSDYIPAEAEVNRFLHAVEELLKRVGIPQGAHQ